MDKYKLPQVDVPRLKLPLAVEQVLKEFADKLAHRPRLRDQFLNCFPNTLNTTVKLMDDGTTFVITGDIPAMWLRDSVEQLIHYVPLAKDDSELQRIIAGVVKRHMMYASHDIYANAFNETANHWHWDANDNTEMSAWVWERKFELDSLCFTIRLAYQYWQETKRTDIFDERFKEVLQQIIALWQTEQRHAEHSPYRFERYHCPATDTLCNGGKGLPVNYTGMIWSGFRPSDDTCDFHYNIPANMFAVVCLRQIREIAQTVFRDQQLAATAEQLETEVERGINLYGKYNHPKYGTIYAYETDGYGNYILMDDAGTPSLLSIPYLGYTDKNDEVYLNTRRFILSTDNPYYYEGQAAKGIGSPHTPPGYIWPMALSMQGLTASTDAEMQEMIALLEATDAGTGFMHEGFHGDDPQQYTRPWFAWSNSLFAQLVYHAVRRGII